MWSYLLCATGLAFGGSMVALIEALSSLKYVCTDSDDTFVTVALVLDWVRFVCGLLLVGLVGWGNAICAQSAESGKKWQEYLNQVGALLICLLASMLFNVVQQSEACVNCITDTSVEEGTIVEDVRRMLGGASCANKFTDVSVFKIPVNYCKRQLGDICTPQPLGNVYAERCLVYACSSHVHGASFRYLFGVTCQMVQVLVCIAVLLLEPCKFTQTDATKMLQTAIQAAEALLPAESTSIGEDASTVSGTAAVDTELESILLLRPTSGGSIMRLRPGHSQTPAKLAF
jgi:hypothetical protein